MNLTSQRRMAAALLKVGKNRVVFDGTRLSDIKEAITREDIRILIKKGAIGKRQKIGVSRGRARKNEAQKSKGRRSGHGSRGGGRTAREHKKRVWIQRVRAMREELRKIRDEGLDSAGEYRKLYKQVGGNLFHGRRHLREQLKLKVKKK